MGTRKKKQRTHVVFILDDSGSMASVEHVAQKVFNKMITDTQQQAAEKNQKTLASVITFGHRVDVVKSHQPIEKLAPLSYYHPVQGSTALFNGLMKGVELLDEVVELKTYEDSFLVILVTDGGENSSSSFNINRAANVIKEKQAAGNWTFVFMLPPGGKWDFCNRYGVPLNNVMEWERTQAGVENMSNVTTSALSEYYNQRSMGARSTCNFFVQPDLSKVSSAKIKRELRDISQKCKVYTLTKEEVIKDFVEKKTKKSYMPGMAYYQLMKKEKVQADKNVVLVEKNKPEIWAGPGARDMIGLPIGADAKVEPGNHANYDIFIESNSINRILPRGTKLIIIDI